MFGAESCAPNGGYCSTSSTPNFQGWTLQNMVPAAPYPAVHVRKPVERRLLQLLCARFPQAIPPFFLQRRQLFRDGDTDLIDKSTILQSSQKLPARAKYPGLH